MDGISAFSLGQPGFDPGEDGDLPEGVFGAAFDTSYLIHGIKAGGSVASPSVPSSSGDFFSSSLSDDLGRRLGVDDDLDSRLVRYQEKLERSLLMGRWIARDTSLRWWRGVGAALRTCGSRLLYRHYYRVDEWRLSGAILCGLGLLCPLCAGMRGSKHLRSAVAKVLQVSREAPLLVPMLFSGTMRNETDVKAMFQRLNRLVSLMLVSRREALKGKRRWNVWCEFDGGILSFEVKRGSGSGLWHVHFHSVVLARAGISVDHVRAAWSDLCGYEAQSDLRPLKCAELMASDRGSEAAEKALVKDLMEVFKYACKFSDMSLEDNFAAYRALRGKRLVRAFGSLRGVKLDEGSLLDELTGLDGQEYLEYAFRLVSGFEGRRYRVGRIQRVVPGVDGAADAVSDVVRDPEEFPSIDGDYL